LFWISSTRDTLVLGSRLSTSSNIIFRLSQAVAFVVFVASLSRCICLRRAVVLFCLVVLIQYLPTSGRCFVWSLQCLVVWIQYLPSSGSHFKVLFGWRMVEELPFDEMSVGALWTFVGVSRLANAQTPGPKAGTVRELVQPEGMSSTPCRCQEQEVSTNHLAFRPRRFVISPFGLVAFFLVLSCRYVFASITLSSPSSPSPSRQITCPAHPSHTRIPLHTRGARKGGRAGDLRHEDVPGGGKRIGSGANAPDAGFAKEVRGVPGSWKDWKLEGMEGHRCGDALGLEDLGIVSLKLRKSGNFFFVLID
jgi:hypothetical protein